MRTLAKAWMLFISAMAAAGCAQGQTMITIDPTTRHQIMRGWEVTSEVPDGDHPEAVPLYRDKLFDLVVDEVGIDRLRVEVRSGAENTNRAWTLFRSGQVSYQQYRPMRYPTINDNDDPKTINWAGFDFSELDENIETNVLPLKRRIEARGERLFINLCYVAFTGQITAGVYQHGNPEEYAEFVLATYLHLRDKYGLSPDSWEVLLEPDNDIKQWNPTVMGRAMAATARRLKENGFTPAFVAPSTTDMANAVPWIEGVAKVPGAMEHVVEFSYHRYQNSNASNAQRIAEAGAKYGKPTSMLEWWFGNGNYRVLYEDVAVANNASWQGRVAGGLFDIRVEDPKAPTVSLSRETRLNRQYFRYIRFGAQRIAATSTDPYATRPTAFVNRDGGLAIVIDTQQATTLTIRGVSAGQYEFTYALEDGETGAATPVTKNETGDLAVLMPGRGVITITTAKPPAR